MLPGMLWRLKCAGGPRRVDCRHHHRKRYDERESAFSIAENVTQQLHSQARMSQLLLISIIAEGFSADPVFGVHVLQFVVSYAHVHCVVWHNIVDRLI